MYKTSNIERNYIHSLAQSSYDFFYTKHILINVSEEAAEGEKERSKKLCLD